jgi:hypothetical protein
MTDRLSVRKIWSKPGVAEALGYANASGLAACVRNRLRPVQQLYAGPGGDFAGYNPGRPRPAGSAKRLSRAGSHSILR